MGTNLIKASKTEDVYVLWSGGADEPIGVLTAKEAKKWFVKQAKKRAKEDFERTLFDTDEWGSANAKITNLGYGGWNDEELPTQLGSHTKGQGYVKRTDLVALTEAYCASGWDPTSTTLDQYIRVEHDD